MQELLLNARLNEKIADCVSEGDPTSRGVRLYVGFKCSIFPDDFHKDVDTSEDIQMFRLVRRENFFTEGVVRLPRGWWSHQSLEVLKS